MSEEKRRYIPALHFRWLTPLYDPLLRWGMREEPFKRRLIAEAGIEPGMEVLDLGCGTGTLTVRLKRAHPQATVTGLDGDPEVLALAQAKAEQAGVNIQWDHGMAYKLPYPDQSFNRVLTSLVLHHLDPDDKRKTFREVLRVLQPGGGFYIVDFGPPHSTAMRMAANIMAHFEETADLFKGHLPPMLTEAGFAQIAEKARFSTLLGPLSLLRADRPVIEKEAITS